MTLETRHLKSLARRTSGGLAAGPDPAAVFRRFADALERRLGAAAEDPRAGAAVDGRAARGRR